MKPSARTLYSLLFFYIAASFTYYSANIVSLVDGFWAHHARLAFQIDFERLTLTELKPEATEAGLAEGDQIVSLNGPPYAHHEARHRHYEAVTELESGVIPLLASQPRSASAAARSLNSAERKRGSAQPK